MFCHKCGAKLVNGALYCSRCGTRVPEEIIREMEETATPMEPVSSPSPICKPEPDPVPMPVPEFSPAPESKPEPAAVNQSDFEPVPADVCEPESNQDSVPGLESAPVLTPAPEPAQESKREINPASGNQSELVAEAALVCEPESSSVSEADVEFSPALECAPEPLPEQKPEPEPMPADKPEPELLPADKPDPIPESAAKPDPERSTRPEPVSANESEPMPVSEHEPVSQFESTPPDEKIYIPLTVTYTQVQTEDTLVLEDVRFIEPIQLTLRKNMKDGMRLRLTNAKVRPAANGARQIAVVELIVVGNPSTAPKTVSAAQSSVRQPAGQTPVQQSTVQTPVRQTAAQPAASHASTQQTRPRTAVSFAPVSSKCAFQLCAENALVTGYKFGGADQEGNIEIAPSGLTLFQKSKAVGMAFGIIGSAIEGKGKQVAIIRPADIKSYEKNTKNGRFLDYRIHLKDGRVLKVSFATMQLDSVVSAADRFLSQV